MFQRPKNDVLAQRWLDNVPGITQINKNDCVCEVHFEEKYIVASYDENTNVKVSL